MESLLHRSPTVGSVIKKIVTINPALGTPEIIHMIRQSVRAQGGNGNEFASAEIIDEEQALSLARASLAAMESSRLLR